MAIIVLTSENPVDSDKLNSKKTSRSFIKPLREAAKLTAILGALAAPGCGNTSTVSPKDAPAKVDAPTTVVPPNIVGKSATSVTANPLGAITDEDGVRNVRTVVYQGNTPLKETTTDNTLTGLPSDTPITLCVEGEALNGATGVWEEKKACSEEVRTDKSPEQIQMENAAKLLAEDNTNEMYKVLKPLADAGFIPSEKDKILFGMAVITLSAPNQPSSGFIAMLEGSIPVTNGQLFLSLSESVTLARAAQQ